MNGIELAAARLDDALPDDDHFFRVEVTVAACIATPEGHALGDNMVDVTLGFSLSMARPPRTLTDAEINQNLTHHISPILAAVQTTLTSLGFTALGTIDPPMTDGSTPTGEFGVSTPVTVRISLPSSEARA